MMPSARRWCGRGVGTSALALIAVLGFLTASDGAQPWTEARQVTLFGIVATPGSRAIDPKLASVSGQLRRLLPDHGFRLLDVRSKRLEPGQSVACKLGDGFVAETKLVDPLDGNGKIQLRCELRRHDQEQFATLVTTPPNQLFFCEKRLNDGSRILIGVGAR
jgi:hypothetical protein